MKGQPIDERGFKAGDRVTYKGYKSIYRLITYVSVGDVNLWISIQENQHEGVEVIQGRITEAYRLKWELDSSLLSLPKRDLYSTGIIERVVKTRCRFCHGNSN